MTTKNDSEKAAESLRQTKKPSTLRELIVTVVAAVLIATGLRTVFYEPFHIPSESMMPTLLVGDYLFVNKFAYGYSKHSLPFSPNLFDGRVFESPVERGDVAVFKRPLDNSTDYIKRIVGLPGDTLQMRGGVLYINDEPVLKERVEDFVFVENPYSNCRGFPHYRMVNGDGNVECHYPQYQETLPNGRRYMTLDLMPNGAADSTDVFIVPEGHYFGMGDNRDNSNDSRRPMHIGVGYIPAENLVGRASIIFFSTDGTTGWLTFWRWFSATRFGRFFTGLWPDEAGDT